MRTIGAAKFKEQCLSILDDVDPEGIIITKRGKPVAKLVPLEETFESLHGKYRDKIKVVGDILTTGLKWDAQP
jgi:prevent-host-death family protein